MSKDSRDIEFSGTSDRGIATLAVLAAVRRWITAKDAEERYRTCLASDKSALWPLIHKRLKALKNLEEAARISSVAGRAGLRRVGSMWPRIRKEQKALEALEEAARKLELAK